MCVGQTGVGDEAAILLKLTLTFTDSTDKDEAGSRSTNLGRSSLGRGAVSWSSRRRELGLTPLHTLSASILRPGET